MKATKEFPLLLSLRLKRAQVRDYRIRAVLGRCSEGWHENLSLSTLSAIANLSTRHLCTVFKRETGTSLRGYLQALRMARAADMLRSSTLTVKEVAGAVGYTAASNFDRDFKRIWGARPSDWRIRAIERAPPGYVTRSSGRLSSRFDDT